MTMVSLWPLDLEAVHLWLSLILFMVVQFIIFVVKSYYING